MEILKMYGNQKTYIDQKGNLVSERHKRISKDLSSTNIKIEKPTNLDLLSLLHYGTPLLFWLIGDYNNILDPFMDIPVGTTLKIPVIE